MIESHCEQCGQQVWRAVNERAGRASVEFYSEAQCFMLRVLDGGLPRAIPVHGIYQKHVCARRMVIHNADTRRDKIGQRNRKPIAARAVRARRTRQNTLP